MANNIPKFIEYDNETCLMYDFQNNRCKFYVPNLECYTQIETHRKMYNILYNIRHYPEYIKGYKMAICHGLSLIVALKFHLHGCEKFMDGFIAGVQMLSEGLIDNYIPDYRRIPNINVIPCQIIVNWKSYVVLFNKPKINDVLSIKYFLDEFRYVITKMKNYEYSTIEKKFMSEGLINDYSIIKQGCFDYESKYKRGEYIYISPWTTFII